MAIIASQFCSARYLVVMAMSINRIFELWRVMYTHILQRHSLSGDRLFIEYRDPFEPSALERLAEFSRAISNIRRILRSLQNYLL
jgi:hypothetical protein